MYGTAKNESLLRHSFAYTGCFGSFNTASCVRDSCLTVLAFVTCLICVFKVYKLHTHHHSLPNQYIIYYSGIINCILCGLNWIYLAKTAVHFVTQFLKTACQVLVVTHFHCLLASRMTRQDNKVRLLATPSILVTVIYLLITAIVGLATMKTEYYECIEPEWLLLSCAEFVIVQVFVVSGLLIVRELNRVQMLETDRTMQKRDLWGIIFVFEMSSTASVIHDIVMRITGPKNFCQGVFVNTEVGYTALYITVNIIRWLLPLWAIAAIFGIETHSDWDSREQRVPILINAQDTGNITSEFRPRGSSFNYKHLYEPRGPPLVPSQSQARSLPGIASSYGSMGSNLGQSPRTRSGDTYPPI